VTLAGSVIPGRGRAAALTADGARGGQGEVLR
jgi:hypothetical protein